MGLDMYLEGHEWSSGYGENIDGKPVRKKVVELGYWRKHPDLHGFIVQNFADGVDQCQEIELSVEQLQEILEANEKDRLPHTEGFFFGASQPEDKAETRKIIGAAIKWVLKRRRRPVKMGDVVTTRYAVYRASW